ncbi:MAG: anhydro-N-acetylmuramic acid kinase [Rhodospirillaceae bacterium]|nr:anhydro-N-acetylmuramic acid kinase [Rhodospirillaceae bacterium]
MRRLRAIGLMSGTSMDGVDAALLETDGDTIFAFGPVASLSYDEDFRNRLRTIVGHPPDDSAETASIIRQLTEIHADVVRMLLENAGMAATDINLLGFHGQTVFHAPHDGVTYQVGDAALLAELTGIDTIADFRSRDMAAGGEGAPFAPVYHVALSRPLERPLAVLNIGGVANVTWISPDGGALAFDTGPGNALVDDWVKSRTGATRDQDGKLARRGDVADALLEPLMENPYFAKPVPKSLDRDAFDDALSKLQELSDADGAATLTAFTARTIAKATDHFPAPPLRWLVTGGGRHNPALMAALRRELALPVEPVEAVGWDGDALEAQAFAFLAARSLFAMPLSFPQTTGVSKPVSGGRLFEAP